MRKRWGCKHQRQHCSSSNNLHSSSPSRNGSVSIILTSASVGTLVHLSQKTALVVCTALLTYKSVELSEQLFMAAMNIKVYIYYIAHNKE